MANRVIGAVRLDPRMPAPAAPGRAGYPAFSSADYSGVPMSERCQPDGLGPAGSPALSSAYRQDVLLHVVDRLVRGVSLRTLHPQPGSCGI